MAVSRITFYISVLIFIFCFSACTVIKNYPNGKPFVSATNVHVRGELKDIDRKELELQLANQFHDSIKVRTAAKLIGWDEPILFLPKLFYDLQNNPPVFDTLNAEKSKQFMRDYLNSLGYFRDSIAYTVKTDTSKDGERLETTLDFNVYPNIVTRLDSIAYRLNADTAFATAREKRNQDTIQQITIDNLQGSVIKKGDPFSKYKLS